MSLAVLSRLQEGRACLPRWVSGGEVGGGGGGDPLEFEAPEGRGVARMGFFFRVQGLRGVGKGVSEVCYPGGDKLSLTSLSLKESGLPVHRTLSI